MAAVHPALVSSLGTAAYSTQPVVTSVIPASCPVSVVAQRQDAPWGGGCAWQCDKTSFKEFCVRAVNGSPNSRDRKELYGFLAECFLDADSDRDGLVSMDEFDFLIERAASLPRRFGLAPSWVECYGDVEGRQRARKEMFRQMDKDQSGKIGMEEWVEFTMAHIAEKVRTLSPGTVDFSHLERSTQEDFVSFLEVAMQNRHSEQYKALYEHLFKTFVEKDVMVKGAINFEEFDLLIEEAAKAPRTLGLAPQAHQAYDSAAHRQASRKQLFDTMDKDKGGTITFDEYLGWAVSHIAQKIQEFRAGHRYQAPVHVAPAVTVSAAPVTYAAAPVTYAAAPAVTSVSSAPHVAYAAPTQSVTYAQPATYAAAPVAAQPVTYAASAPVTYAVHPSLSARR